MVERVELRIDVTEAAGLGESAHIAATVHLPVGGPISERPVVCFSKPGGGYSKGYFTEDLPGPGRGAQADWHANRGWIFVSIDHLGVGSSSSFHDPNRLDFAAVAGASQAAEIQILDQLATGGLSKEFPPVIDPLLLGVGQSMGGGLTIIQQGRYHCYDGIAILGFSAVHTAPPVQPGTPPLTAAWIPRDARLETPVITNARAFARASLTPRHSEFGPAMGWGFYFDDVDQDLISLDLTDFPTRNHQLLPWASATMPGLAAAWCVAPGAVAPEAAAVTVPVLVAMGERDVIVDPRSEPRAYQSATAIDLFICPRMGHMHNFASTRHLLWERIEKWSAWVSSLGAGGGHPFPQELHSGEAVEQAAYPLFDRIEVGRTKLAATGASCNSSSLGFDQGSAANPTEEPNNRYGRSSVS